MTAPANPWASSPSAVIEQPPDAYVYVGFGDQEPIPASYLNWALANFYGVNLCVTHALGSRICIEDDADVVILAETTDAGDATVTASMAAKRSGQTITATFTATATLEMLRVGSSGVANLASFGVESGLAFATFQGGYGSGGVSIFAGGNVFTDGDVEADGDVTTGGGYGLPAGVTVGGDGTVYADQEIVSDTYVQAPLFTRNDVAEHVAFSLGHRAWNVVGTGVTVATSASPPWRAGVVVGNGGSDAGSAYTVVDAWGLQGHGDVTISDTLSLRNVDTSLGGASATVQVHLLDEDGDELATWTSGSLGAALSGASVDLTRVGDYGYVSGDRGVSWLIEAGISNITVGGSVTFGGLRINYDRSNLVG